MESEIVKYAFDYSERYWELGNIITAFVVVQMLGFLYAVVEKKDFLAKVRTSWFLVVTLTGASGLIYSGLIYLCYHMEILTLQSHATLAPYASTSIWAMICRIAIIWIITGLGLVVLILDRQNHKQEYSDKQNI